MENLYSRSVVGYCERLGNSLFSEPINLISNFAFLLSAFFIFRLYKIHKISGTWHWVLFYLTLSIGIGSALWHSFRTPTTHAFDAIPIYLFLLTFLFLLLKNLTKNIRKSIIGILGFLLFQIIVSVYLPGFLNGSIRHVVNASVFILLCLWIYEKKKLNSNLVIALLMYVFGITFRTIDNSVCSVFPFGTHFLWHVLTAIASYFAVKGLVGLESMVQKKI